MPSPSASTPHESSHDGGLGGIVFVSGLSSHYVWSSSPVDSKVLLRFTVRNDAKSSIDSTAEFWATSPVGSRIGTSHKLPISALKPNETRVVETSLSGFGQWTAIHTHVKFSPPKIVDGKKLSSVTRDSFVVVPPVVAIGCGGALAVIALLGVRFAWLARLALIFRSVG
ncbi:hypothetical protein [Lacisediminihabitans changchengi]|uniref:DUF916 domain-containing protein n=1 Tax=Lacisediminihabitans changchengi TaxID=2787634 RepID=A0A934SKY3_9MICO|nr:hypothetical protein [Lacisediminihabitans changchengi]MBK4348607.1 hypothetical protein [Lacisediminihabitans changchengi]